MCALSTRAVRRPRRDRYRSRAVDGPVCIGLYSAPRATQRLSLRMLHWRQISGGSAPEGFAYIHKRNVKHKVGYAESTVVKDFGINPPGFEPTVDSANLLYYHSDWHYRFIIKFFLGWTLTNFNINSPLYFLTCNWAHLNACVWQKDLTSLEISKSE